MLGAYGVGAKLVADCGVAGIHRLLDQVDDLAAADAVVVVAGMEGALASVVAGLVGCPGDRRAHVGGLRLVPRGRHRPARHARVVRPGHHRASGIDNGYGAACAVARLLHCRHPAPCQRRSPGSTASPASPATWRSGRCSTPAPTSTRCGPSCAGCPSTAGASRRVAVHAVRHRRHPRRRARRGHARRPHRTPHIARLVEDAGLPDAGAGPGAGHLRAPRRGRGRACTAAARARSTSTRSAASTPSSTWSAPAPRSRCSASTSWPPSAVATGTGMVRAAHGLLPNPAPAVVGLLRRARPPTAVDVPGRAHHPDRRRPARRASAAHVRPAAGDGRRRRSGYGAGTRELDGLPNLHPGGDRRRRRARPGTGQPLVAARGQRRRRHRRDAGPRRRARCSSAGALDAWVTPIVMKKGRPGHMVAALCDPALAGPARRRAAGRDRHASGCGPSPCDRWAADRRVRHGRRRRRRRSGSRSARAGSRPSSTTPPASPGRGHFRCARW